MLGITRSTSTPATCPGSSPSTSASGFTDLSDSEGWGHPCTSRWAGRVTVGIADVDAAIADHGLSPNLGGRPVEIVLWTDDVGREYARLTGAGAALLGAPYDFLSDLR